MKEPEDLLPAEALLEKPPPKHFTPERASAPNPAGLRELIRGEHR